jgi:hypothetical protein
VHPYVLNCSKQKKNEEDRGLKLKRGLKNIFFKKIEANYCSSSSYVFCIAPCSFTFNTQRTFVALQFAGPMTQKLLNLVRE